MLTVIVTLTFDRLTSKSIWIIYSPKCMSVPDLRNLGQLCLVIIQTRFGLYVNMLTVTVTSTFDLKINRDHLYPKMHVFANFEEPRSILCLLSIRTRFGLYFMMTITDLDLSPIDLKVDRDHLHPKMHVCQI